jgi:voltage-gated sodium channel
MSTYLGQIVASPGFNRFILGAIIVSAVLVGAETFPQFDPSTTAGRVVLAVQNAILWIFVVEILMRMGAHGPRPWRYFYDPWNVFDFVVVFICFLPLETNYVSVLRMARVLRTLRLVSALPHLQLLVTALLRSVPSIGYVGLLLALHFYVYAVAGTFLFRQNDPLHFGDLSRSSLTLFQVLTMEGWPEYLRIQMHGSDVYYHDDQKRLAGANRQSVASPLVAPAYFISFILFGTMIVMNLFTGVIVQGLEEAEEEVAKRTREEHDEIMGHTTVGDEINVLRERLEEISQRMHLLLSEQSEALQAGFYED